MGRDYFRNKCLIIISDRIKPYIQPLVALQGAIAESCDGRKTDHCFRSRCFPLVSRGFRHGDNFPFLPRIEKSSATLSQHRYRNSQRIANRATFSSLTDISCEFQEMVNGIPRVVSFLWIRESEQDPDLLVQYAPSQTDNRGLYAKSRTQAILYSVYVITCPPFPIA